MRRFFVVGIFLVKKCRDNHIPEVEFARGLGVDEDTWNRVRVGGISISQNKVRCAIGLLGMSEAEWLVEIGHFEDMLEKQGYLTYRSPDGQGIMYASVEDVARVIGLVLNQGAEMLQGIAKVVGKHPIPFAIGGCLLLGLAVAGITKNNESKRLL